MKSHIEENIKKLIEEDLFFINDNKSYESSKKIHDFYYKKYGKYSETDDGWTIWNTVSTTVLNREIIKKSKGLAYQTIRSKKKRDGSWTTERVLMNVKLK